MQLKIGHGVNGITFGLEVEPPVPLVPDPAASQTNPLKCYVYGHRTVDGKLFYIGKGTGGRAWNADRHPLWHRYVNNHLGGQFEIVILRDNLDSSDADQLEAEWTDQESANLVNWTNFARPTDLEANKRYHTLRQECLGIADEAKTLEASDVSRAIELYNDALTRISGFAHIQSELGLVGQLIMEERQEYGVNGELRVLDRLTLCLCRSGRTQEARDVTENYFREFRADLSLSAAERILKRISPRRSG